MPSRNKEVTNERTDRRHPPSRKASLSINVAVRPMTDEEARQFDSALDFLLTETIRQRIGREREKHGTIIA